MSDSDSDSGGNFLLGFAFGNVDAKGKAELDYLDEDAKGHLAVLSKSKLHEDLGLKVTEDDYDEAEEPAAPDREVAPARDAVDYTDETQLAEDEAESTKPAPAPVLSVPVSTWASQRAAVDAFMADDEDYDADEPKPPGSSAAAAMPAAGRPTMVAAAAPGAGAKPLMMMPAGSAAAAPAPLAGVAFGSAAGVGGGAVVSGGPDAAVAAVAADVVAGGDELEPDLPVLVQTDDGEVILHFSQLFGKSDEELRKMYLEQTPEDAAKDEETKQAAQSRQRRRQERAAAGDEAEPDAMVEGTPTATPAPTPAKGAEGSAPAAGAMVAQAVDDDERLLLTAVGTGLTGGLAVAAPMDVEGFRAASEPAGAGEEEEEVGLEGKVAREEEAGALALEGAEAEAEAADGSACPFPSCRLHREPLAPKGRTPPLPLGSEPLIPRQLSATAAAQLRARHKAATAAELGLLPAWAVAPGGPQTMGARPHRAAVTGGPAPAPLAGVAAYRLPVEEDGDDEFELGFELAVADDDDGGASSSGDSCSDAQPGLMRWRRREGLGVRMLGVVPEGNAALVSTHRWEDDIIWGDDDAAARNPGATPEDSAGGRTQMQTAGAASASASAAVANRNGGAASMPALSGGTAGVGGGAAAAAAGGQGGPDSALVLGAALGAGAGGCAGKAGSRVPYPALPPGVQIQGALGDPRNRPLLPYGALHPQLLRLEGRPADPSSVTQAAVPASQSAAAALDAKLRLQPWLRGSGWVREAREWEDSCGRPSPATAAAAAAGGSGYRHAPGLGFGGAGAGSRAAGGPVSVSISAAGAAPLVLDLNDPRMVFMAPDEAGLRHAGALVRVAPPPLNVVTGPSMNPDDEVACELAKFNISRDSHYAHSRRSRSDRGIHLRVNVKHATPALKLTTLPYTLSKQELRHFHRPRYAWHPAALGPLKPPSVNCDAGSVPLIIWSATGRTAAAAVKATQELLESTVGAIIEKFGAKVFPEIKTGGPTPPVPYRVYLMRGSGTHLTLTPQPVSEPVAQLELGAALTGACAQAAAVAATAAAVAATAAAAQATQAAAMAGAVASGAGAAGAAAAAAAVGSSAAAAAGGTGDKPAGGGGKKAGAAGAADKHLAALSVHLFLEFPVVQLLLSRVANTKPHPESQMPLRPPSAFGKVKEFTPSEGHLLLLEYMEEHPPLLGHQGMGVKITTYYKKKSETDAMGQQLISRAVAAAAAAAGAGAAGGVGAGGGSAGAGAAAGGGAAGAGAGGSAAAAASIAGGGSAAWRIGHVQALTVDEDSPFLGNLKPGQSLMSVETGMYRAPATPHSPAPTDFLLIRGPGGVLQLREITGELAVGQQQPCMRVPQPTSVEVEELVDHRLLACVARMLRTREEKLRAKPGATAKASIKVEELRPKFPTLTQAGIVERLKSMCGCLPVADGSTAYGLDDSVTLMQEGELRRLVTPEKVCSVESMVAAREHATSLGVHNLEVLSVVAPERLAMALEQLPLHDPQVAAAAEVIEWAVCSAPWVTTDAFVSTMRDNRGAVLAITGPGDPTGRGHGLCFVSDAYKRNARDNVLKAPETGSLTGSDSDLRKLSAETATNILLSFGVDRSIISAQTNRWRLIDLVRQLATAAARDGSNSEIARKYTRAMRNTQADQMDAMKAAAQKVWEVQLEALERDAEPTGSAAPSRLQQQKRKVVIGEPGGGAGDEDDEENEYKKLQAQGFFGEGARGKDAPVSRKEKAAEGKKDGADAPKPGERRLKRVMVWTTPEGVKQSYTAVYSERTDIALVNQLVAAKDGGGFGERRVSGVGLGLERIVERVKKKERELQAGRGRGRGRGGRGGRGRGGGPVTALAVPMPTPKPKSAVIVDDDDDLEILEPAAPPPPPPTCVTCGQLGHKTSKSKKCPHYVARAPKPEGAPPEEEEAEEEEEAPDEEDLYLLKQQQQQQGQGRKRMARGASDATMLTAGAGAGMGIGMGLEDGMGGYGGGGGRPAASEGLGFGTHTRSGRGGGGGGGGADSDAEYRPPGATRSRSARRSAPKAIDDDFDIELEDDDDEVVMAEDLPAASDPSASLGSEGMEEASSEERRPAASARKRPRERYAVTDSSDSGGGGGPVRSSRKSAGAPARSKRGGGGARTAATASMAAAGAGGGDQSTADWGGTSGGRSGAAPSGTASRKGGSQQRIDGRALLKRHLDNIISLIRRDKTYLPFENPVSKASVPDYNVWVPEKSEMWLKRVREKTRRYTSSTQFLADLQQIADNARAYNTYGHGRLGTPQLMQLADNMVALARNELSKAWEDIEAADEALQNELAAKSSAPALDSVDPAPDSVPAEGVVVVTQDLWLQCEACHNWRIVPQDMHDQYAESSLDWFCKMLPGVDCSTPAPKWE